MTTMTIDARLHEVTHDAHARPLPTALAQARDSLQATVDAVLALPESALARPWAWVGGGEEEVRYAAYHAQERFERAGIDAVRSLAGRDPGLAASIVAPATAARWDLHGVLAGVSDADLDADPGGDEWTIRYTLGHTISGQRAYGWGSGWWLAQGLAVDDPSLPERSADDDWWLPLPMEEDEAAGSKADVGAKLDEVLDAGLERFAGLPEERLGIGSRWSGFAVPIAFRLGRWSSHIREHTVQVEKTLAMLGRAPTEPQRLARLVLAAYGRAEQVVIGHTGSEAEEAAAILRDAARSARDTVASARASVEAGGPTDKRESGVIEQT